MSENEQNEHSTQQVQAVAEAFADLLDRIIEVVTDGLTTHAPDEFAEMTNGVEGLVVGIARLGQGPGEGPADHDNHVMVADEQGTHPICHVGTVWDGTSYAPWHARVALRGLVQVTLAEYRADLRRQCGRDSTTAVTGSQGCRAEF